MPTTLGSVTTSVFEKGVDGNDIHVEFVCGEAIYEGQPVKLDTDGTILALDADDPIELCIGTAMMSRIADELITIATRWRCVIHAMSGDTLTAGIVKYAGYSNDYNDFINLDTPGTTDAYNLTVGHALDAATAADEEILVGLL